MEDIRIEMSESPIWVHNSCEGKEVFFYVYWHTKDSLIYKLDGKEIKTIKVTPMGYQLELSSDQLFNEFTVFKKYNGKESLIFREEIRYYESGDTIEFYSNNYKRPRPIYVDASLCWNGYDGSIIPEGEYIVRYEQSVRDEFEDGNIERILSLKNVQLKNGAQKIFDLDEDLIVEKESIVPKVFSSDKGLGKTLKMENIFYKSSSDHINSTFEQSSLRIKSNGQGKPSFRVVNYHYGSFIKAVLDSCGILDTIKTDRLILPNHVQVELNCGLN